MNSIEIMAYQFAYRFFKANEKRIRTWIENDIETNGSEAMAEFSDFASEFEVNPDVSDMMLDRFVDEMLDFLDHKQKESITSKIWNYLQQRYDSLVDSITAEMEDTNDSDEHIKEEYYRSVL